MRRARRSVVVLTFALAAAVPSPVAAADAPPGPRLHVGVRASGGADATSLPAPTAGADVALVLLSGANRFEVHVAAWIPQAATAPALPSAGLLVSLVAGGGRYCRALVQKTLELGTCAGLEGGAMLARTFGVSAPAAGAGPWVAPSLGLLGQWNASPSFSFGLSLEGVAAALRPSLALAGLGPIFHPRPGTFRALFGVEARLR